MARDIPLNTDGYVRIKSEDWGDIIILKAEIFESMRNSSKWVEVENKSNQENLEESPDGEEPTELYLFSQNFGHWVHGKIKEKKINQSILAKELQTTQATISRIVANSSMVVPSLEIRLKVYRYLSASI